MLRLRSVSEPWIAHSGYGRDVGYGLRATCGDEGVCEDLCEW